MEIIRINTDQIIPNEYNPNVVPDDIMAKLRAEIAQKGLCEPIIVRPRADGYEVVDGEHRWRTCRDLGISKIPCIIQEYSDSEAKIKTIQLNYMRGSVVPIKLAALVHELSKEIKLEDLARQLPYDEPQLQDNLELLKLPENYGNELEAQAQRNEEEMPSVYTFVLFKNQQEVVENALEIAGKSVPEGTKNSKAIALAKICSYFLMGKGLEETPVTSDEESQTS